MSIIITIGIFLVIIGIVNYVKDNYLTILDYQWTTTIFILVGITVIVHAIIHIFLMQ